MVQYFQHDTNAQNDEKIVRLRMKHGAAGYGIYFMLLERMADSATYTCSKDYQLLAYALREDQELIRSVVEDFDLFTVEESCFYSDSMIRRISERDASAKARSEHAKKAVEARIKKREQNSRISQDDKENISSSSRDNHEITDGKPLKERKENKEKDNKNIKPPPQGSSLNSEVEAAGAAEEDKDLVLIYNRKYCDAVMRIRDVGIPPGTSVTDLMKIARFISDGCVQPAAIRCMIESKPLYEVIQFYEGLENKDKIQPLSRNIWYCLTRLHSLCLADQQKIFSLMRGHPEMFDDLEIILKEIDDNPKIKQPSRYIISKLTKS